jgi:hypothetical protein
MVSPSRFSSTGTSACATGASHAFWGRPAIREWLAREIIGDHVTMYVTESRKHTDGRCFVVAKVTGTYDKTGLPDPLTLRFYFSATGDLLTQLIIIPSQ